MYSLVHSFHEAVLYAPCNLFTHSARLWNCIVGIEALTDDENPFSIPGDVFEKLEDEDEQGWCKGRKDGRVGLYPANYIEVIE